MTGQAPRRVRVKATGQETWAVPNRTKTLWIYWDRCGLEAAHQTDHFDFLPDPAPVGVELLPVTVDKETGELICGEARCSPDMSIAEHERWLKLSEAAVINGRSLIAYKREQNAITPAVQAFRDAHAALTPQQSVAELARLTDKEN